MYKKHVAANPITLLSMLLAQQIFSEEAFQNSLSKGKSGKSLYLSLTVEEPSHNNNTSQD